MKVTPFLQTDNFDFYKVYTEIDIILPFYDAGVQAGFPSPATDFLENGIDLYKHLIKNPSSTFITKAKGVSMRGAGIDDGDILIIDKSIEPFNGVKAICVIDNEFTLKTLIVQRKEIFLMPENENFKPIKVTEYNDFEIWGILTFSIKPHKH